MAKDPIYTTTLKDGTKVYGFKTDIGRDPQTNRRRQTELRFPTRKEARAEYARIRHEVGKGTYVAPSALLVDPFVDDYLKTATRDVEAATAANYRDALRPVRERLGERKLQSLTEQDIEGLVDWMLTAGRKRGGKPGSGLSARSVSLTLGRLRAALEVAVRRQYVTRNVATYVRVPREARKAAALIKAARTPWTEVEVKAFLTGVREHRLYAPTLLALMGLRPAETCGLRWEEDVNLDAEVIAAGANTRTLVDGKVVEKDAKSEAGDRGLPLPKFATAALRSFKARQAAEKLAAGSTYAETGYVLVDEVGKPFTTEQLRKALYKMMAEVGVRKVRPYDARHAALTYLAGAGVPDVVVSAWAGHADLSFTKRTYIHPDASHLKVAADKYDELFG